MKQKVNDYKQMLLDININQNQMDLITNTKNIIETSSDIYNKMQAFENCMKYLQLKVTAKVK